ncbi:MAG: Bax inhibitor-1 family protein [Pirellulales bacterium]
MAANYNNPYLNNTDEGNPYASFGMPVAFAAIDERTTFIRKTYAHLLGAVLAFVGLEFLLFQSGVAENIIRTLFLGRWAWIGVIVAFMAVSYIANKWANSATSLGMQYAGLALYVVAESIIFLPILYIVTSMMPNGERVLATAGLITAVLFGGLSAIVFLTKADFSGLGKYLGFGCFALMAVAVIGMFMGPGLGLIVPGFGVALMCGYILYDTSNVMHHYSTKQYVAASLALFATLATLFYYVLRIVMEISGRD